MSGATLKGLVRTWRTHPVTHDKLASAVARFVRWQIASRIHGGKLVFPFVEPTRLMAARGQTSATGNLYFGLLEFPEMAFLLHFLRPDDVFIDVGANMGVFSVLASGVVGARSIAFEPAATTIVELNEQLRLNDIVGKVDIRPVALGDRIGTVRFFDTRGSVNRVVAEGETREGSCDVPQSTLDQDLAGNEPALIKMDVEGYEFAILKGASKVLASPALQAIILEVHEGTSTYGVDRSALEGLLSEAGFKPYSYDAFRRELTEVEFADAHAHGLSDNVLIIRDIEAVRQRVSAAPKFTVLGRSF